MTRITVAKEYSEFNKTQKEEYFNYEIFKIKEGFIDNYQICKRVGRGKYSEVFEGRIVATGITCYEKELEEIGSKCIIKVLKPVRDKKINREILILKNIEHENIIKMFDVVKDPETSTFSLIFEYINHKESRNLFESFDINEIKHYSRQILKALDYSHSRGIIHRDIKPHNMIIDQQQKVLKIIDWGLAEFYHPKTEYNVKVASRFYKGPELLVEYGYYDYSLDLWSFGCVLAEMLFKRMPFFQGEDNLDQLLKIIAVLGKTEFMDYLSFYEIKLLKEVIKKIPNGERKPLISFLDSANRNEDYEDAIDMLEKLLRYDHQERLTAKECLNHPFLKE